MKRRTMYMVWVFGAVLWLGLAPGTARAAEFQSLTYDGLTELLAANKGKIVMVNFFASWCPPCKAEIPTLIKLRKELGNKMFLIGLSLDEDMAALQKFIRDMKIDYPVKLSAMDLSAAAGVSAIPHMLIFDGKGEVVGNASGLIPEDDLRAFLKQHMETK